MNNDRFKFRVWDITNNEYRRNSYIWTLNQIGYLTNDSMISLTSFSEEPDFEYIIEQSTGLKDKNGKLIFEGDVIEDDNTKDTTYEVIFDDNSARFMLKGYDGELRLIRWNIRVIGNIHDKE